MTRPRREEEGSATVELLAMVPLLVLLLLLIVAVGRSTYTSIQVSGAAAAAARAAALARTPGYGQAAAQSAAATALPAAITCTGGPRTAVDTSRFRPGGDVAVTLTCQVSYADLAVPGLPGARTYTAQAAAPIETYREAPR